jgi:hypothetical protein
MTKRFLKTLTIAAAMTPLLTACDDSTGPESGASQLTVLLTDAPGDLVSAVVTIESIYLQGRNGEHEGGDRVYLRETAVTTDLLELSNDAVALVENEAVPSGSYGQLRFVISGGYIEVENEDGSTSIFASDGYEHLPAGRTADGHLQMPSLAKSGLKVTFQDGIEIDDFQEVVLIDFDVAQSFGHQAGNSGRWVMTPVIKGAHFELASSVEATLALADGVTLPEVDSTQLTLADFGAQLVDAAGNTKEAAFQEVDGVFTARFPYLMPDASYQLSLKVPAGATVATDLTLPIDVTTVSAEVHTFEVTITEAAVSESS